MHFKTAKQFSKVEIIKNNFEIGWVVNNEPYLYCIMTMFSWQILLLISRDSLKQRHIKNQERFIARRFGVIMTPLSVSIKFAATFRDNVAANLNALLKKCYILACVNQHWTCKRIPSVPRCLFRPFIVISVLIMYKLTSDLTQVEL